MTIALQKIPIIEDYLQYQANRGCYSEKTLTGWRPVLTRVYWDNGLEALKSTPYNNLNLGHAASRNIGEKRYTIRAFRDWVMNRSTA